jgi:PTH1 family peptidyl-tRNA hydrolase
VSDRPKLVVGLGNPGAEYGGTRHNIGFAVVEALAGKWQCGLRSRPKFSGQVGDAPGGVRLLLPETFMNRSGTAVAALANWLKLTPADVLVVVDDADLPLGQLRLRLRGGSGGHNGLRSIIEALGSEEFRRLRVGIGRHGPAGADITGHVLGRFAAAEKAAVRVAVADAVAAIECCVQDGFAVAMNRFNRRKEDAV